ncbi:MAG TPA: amidohydrolase family protein [Candidatus Binatia bacterium]|nr:amidohydrolase family protein [Candidatus Binatia bacterium]
MVRAVRRVCLALVILICASGWAQTESGVAEQGVFNLHKFEQLIGKETYTLTRTSEEVTLKSDFKFTDRGTPVPLTASLTMDKDLTPLDFQIKGKISRFSSIENTVHGRSAGAVTIPAGESFFDIQGYAPVSVQMMLVRYWRSHGSPKTLKTLPRGEVQIQDQGAEQFAIGKRQVQLHKLSIRGLIWGMESLWMDEQDHVVALVSVDAEMDHFEAVAEGYEDGLANFVAGAARDGMANLAKVAAGFTAEPASVTAIVGGRLIDGTGKPAVENAVVILQNGRIAAAGPAASTPVPQGAQIVDANGKSVLPGLWEMHAHFEQVEWGPIYLATGVTTARDVGNEREFIVAARDAIAAGRGIGPRLVMAGVVDGSGPFSLGIIRVDTPEQAREQVQRYKAAGFQQIKIYSSVKPEILKVVTAEAHRLGMTVTGHIPFGMNAIQGIEDGMDQINHVEYLTRMMVDPKSHTIDPEAPNAKKVIKLLLEHHTVVDDTLALMEVILHPLDHPISGFEPGILKVAPELREGLETMGVPPPKAEQSAAQFRAMEATVRILHQAGVPIVAGTDQAVPGFSLDREIELHVQAGFTPMEAIQSATVVAARAMGMEKDSGTVETGKRADVIVVDGNPLENISDIRKVSAVFAAGKMYQPAALWSAVGFKP